MTANIHPQNIPFYQAVHRNLAELKPHGLQWARADEPDEFEDVPSYVSGMPTINERWAEPLLLRMKPEEPAKETICIGALELPKTADLAIQMKRDYSLAEGKVVCDLCLPLNDISDYKTWRDFLQKLRTGDPETIAAITQQNHVHDLERQLETMTGAWKTAVEAHNWLYAKHKNLEQQQREIDRDALIDLFANKTSQYSLTNEGMADAVIKHLNAKPVESGELSKVAQNIHYPECWDTVAYPTLMDALLEFKCSDCAIEICAQEADRWQRITDTNPLIEKKCKCGEYIAGAIRSLNTKPVTQEPKELVMPDIAYLINDFNDIHKVAIAAFCKANADLFRERGITIPKELTC